ncbi:hypothetical protein ACHHYP_09265 [Achlya hypogyna]|uniref:Flavin reductase like domain-containing protein n=1 Tax=Achlya hypogyna TaxID=1202772 RepID=A0A1V9ZJ70_ACHHY|nr:hypothetical protein ACHHYP_09265 [Achlya hypogyna]
MKYRRFCPRATSPKQLYELLTGAVVPRPIAWVSTLSESGVSNLAPFSFFNVVSIEPPVLFITQVFPKPGSDKDTLRNLRATRECVVNVVSADLATAMNATSRDYPSYVSEMEELAIATVASSCVKPPGVAASPIRMECKLRDVLEIGNGKTMLLDVVHFEVAESLITDANALDSTGMAAIGRMGLNDYTIASDLLNMLRPPPFD